MRFAKTLTAAGVIAAGGALAFGAAPANAASPAPNTIQFDLSANDQTLSVVQPSSHITLSSAAGFQPGTNANITFQNVNGVQGSLNASGWQQSATASEVTGTAGNSINEMGGTIGGTWQYARISKLTVPTAGDSTIGFDLTPQDNHASIPINATHVSMVSDNKFQPGSTTTTTITITDTAHQTQVSIDGGTTWSSSAVSFTSRPGGPTPSIMEKAFSTDYGKWYYATVSGLSPQLPLPYAPNAPIYNTDSTVDITGTGTPGTTITVKDANGNTIGTATVADDGTYEVKIPAAAAATAAAAGPVQVTESDLTGTT